MAREKSTDGPAAVGEATPSQQAGEAQDQWSWVSPEVWTQPMLTRLAKSGPTTKWFRLWDKVWSPANLQSAFWAVWRNQGAAGVDGQSVGQFEERQAEQLAKLGEELRGGSYRAKPARRAWIPKTGSAVKRPLGIPAVRDRVVQSALRHVLEPILEHDFAAHSYGFRPGRGCREAVARVEELLDGGRPWVVDADLRSYFDTIPHERLMKLLGRRVADGSVLRLVEKFLKAGVMETMKGWEPTEVGTPQGGVISPLLANLYLDPLDHTMAARGWEMVRYADDFVLLCRTREEAGAALAFITEWVTEAGLALHPEKTRLVDARIERFDFLGWTFSIKEDTPRKWPRQKSVSKLRGKLRPLSKRSAGRSLSSLVAEINPILRGWHGYFKEAKAGSLRTQDGWLRRRLRALLRKQQKRPGFGKTLNDSKRWPNRWFAERGLFSLEHGSRDYG